MTGLQKKLQLTPVGKRVFKAMAPPDPAVKCKARPRDYKDGEDFSLYLNHFNRVAAANQWGDEIKLVQHRESLKCLLRSHQR